VLDFVVSVRSYPLTPALSPRGARGKGSRSRLYSKPEFGAVLQVGVIRKNTSVSPLSLRERARVRGF
jgi:hypothetical protein